MGDEFEAVRCECQHCYVEFYPHCPHCGSNAVRAMRANAHVLPEVGVTVWGEASWIDEYPRQRAFRRAGHLGDQWENFDGFVWGVGLPPDKWAPMPEWRYIGKGTTP